MTSLLILNMTETKTKTAFLSEARGVEIVLRPLRGLLTLVLCSMPLIPLFALLIPLFVVLRPVNPTLWARITTAMSGYYYFYWMIIIEYVARFKVVISGDKLPFDENALLISNHVCAMDPFFQFCIAARRHRIGNVKFFAKEVNHCFSKPQDFEFIELMINQDIKMYFPWGPAMALVENIFIGRRWVDDDAKIASAFACLYGHPTVPVWLVSFLEGSRLTPKRLLESKSFAKEVTIITVSGVRPGELTVSQNGLPELEHCLYPRVKGFEATIRGAGDLLDAVYDVTLAYNGVPPTVYEVSTPSCTKTLGFQVLLSS